MTTETEKTNQVEQSSVDNRDENMWAMFCHLASFAGFVFPLIGSVLGPLIVWILKKDEYSLVDDQGKEAMNFNISMVIYYIVSIILIFVVIGIPLLIGLFLFDVVVTIVAMIRASEGQKFRYPLCIRLIN